MVLLFFFSSIGSHHGIAFTSIDAVAWKLALKELIVMKAGCRGFDCAVGAILLRVHGYTERAQKFIDAYLTPLPRYVSPSYCCHLLEVRSSCRDQMSR